MKSNKETNTFNTKNAELSMEELNQASGGVRYVGFIYDIGDRVRVISGIFTGKIGTVLRMLAGNNMYVKFDDGTTDHTGDEEVIIGISECRPL